jgi:glyoxylase-like metal-dependent hydrolase (beta-lactamase superfamily II)
MSGRIEMFDIPAVLENGPGVIHPVVIWDNDNVILVDTGLPGMLDQLRDEAENKCIPFERLNKIIITHHDMDHIGCLRDIIETAPQSIDVLAHENEKPYIQAELPPIRLAQLEASLTNASAENRQRFLPLCESLKANYPKFKANVTQTVSDGEELHCCGGVTVIYTPGHTYGHISLYLGQSKTLIAGDILNVENGKLAAAPEFTLVAKDNNAESLSKLLSYDIETVICYHGGLYNKAVKKRIEELAGECENR